MVDLIDIIVPKDYDKQVPPKQDNGPLEVFFRLQVDRILDVDMENNLLSIDMWAFMEWKDNRLLINGSFGSIDTMQLTAKKGELLWKPNFVAWFMKSLVRRDALEELSRITIKNDGTILCVNGVTLRAACQFNADLYPFDLQSCPVKLLPYPASSNEVIFKWANGDKSLYFGMSPGNEVKTPRYVMKLIKLDRSRTGTAPGAKFSVLEFCLQLQRQILTHILAVYVPSGIFVTMSWGSFLIDPELVPGRMVLLVTNLLTLITMFEATRVEIPPSLNMQAMDIWLLSCIIFVFTALMEYACLLFSIRGRDVLSQEVPGDKKEDLFATSVFPLKGLSKGSKFAQKLQVCWICIRNRFHRCCGVCRSRDCFSKNNKWNALDRGSLIIFPIAFFIYNIAYWWFYITKLHEDNSQSCS